MTRTKAYSLRIALAATVLYAGGCGSKAKIPYLGKWSGALEIDSVKGSRFKKEAFRMPGYLQVYATNDKYKMRIEGPQQAIEVTGTWSIRQNSMVMVPADVKIDDFGGENLRNPNLPYLDNDEVQKVFGNTVPFRLSKDKKTAISTSLQVGPVDGSLRFTKGNVGR